MELERRYCELRVEPEARTLAGIAVRYGDEAELPWGVRERIEAGAFGDAGGADAILNVQHDRSRPLARTNGGGLEFVDGGDALRIRARLPNTRDADDTLALVRAGVLRGLSLEFRVKTERLDRDVRVITAASLHGVAVVDRPAYSDSEVAARAAARRKVRPRQWL